MTNSITLLLTAKNYHFLTKKLKKKKISFNSISNSKGGEFLFKELLLVAGYKIPSALKGEMGTFF